MPKLKGRSVIWNYCFISLVILLWIGTGTVLCVTLTIGFITLSVWKGRETKKFTTQTQQ